MLTAEVQYIAEGEEEPIYFASSAGRNARFEVNRGLQAYNVKVHDARDADTDFGSEKMGQPDIGFKLIKHSSAVKTSSIGTKSVEPTKVKSSLF